jgi:hypothetical protein
VAGHRIKPYEPPTLDPASTSPRRLGLRSNISTYFENTLEMARLHISHADCSCRKRQRVSGTTELVLWRAE